METSTFAFTPAMVCGMYRYTHNAVISGCWKWAKPGGAGAPEDGLPEAEKSIQF